MTVGYIHDTQMPSTDANTVNVSKMCDAFTTNGHRVILVCPRLPEGRYPDLRGYYGLRNPIRTIRLPRPSVPGGERLFSIAAALVCRAARVDIVYGRKPHLLLPAFRLGLPVIYEAHAALSSREGRSRASLSHMFGSPRLLRIVAISSALRRDIIAQWPQAEPIVTVAHDGADAHPGQRLPILGSASTRPRIGYAGHLYPGKGMEMIFALAQRRPEYDFLVMGGRGADLDRWRRATADMANVTLTGMVPHPEVPDRLASCDVVLAPYARQVMVSDGATEVGRWMSPLKIFEYMAQGLTIIASDLPVLREVLEDGVDSVLCPPDDVDAWLQALDGLITNEGKRATLGAAARSKLEAKYTWLERARQILDGLV